LQDACRKRKSNVGFRKFDHVIVRAVSDFAPETVVAGRNRSGTSIAKEVSIHLEMPMRNARLASPRKARDLIAQILTVAVLLAVVVLTSGRSRHGIDRFPGSFEELRASAPVAAFTTAAAGPISLIRDFRADNPILFVFLIVAIVMVVLMLRT